MRRELVELLTPEELDELGLVVAVDEPVLVGRLLVLTLELLPELPGLDVAELLTPLLLVGELLLLLDTPVEVLEL